MDNLISTGGPEGTHDSLRREPGVLPPVIADGVDCWNRIGVAGDGSCGELAVAVHCRNCPVYSAAGARLLDTERPADYQRHWTKYFAREKKAATPARHSAVIFQIGHEWLALSTRSFLEVTEPRPIHSLPHRRRGIVLGVTNIRGQLLICISLGRLLGIGRGSGPAARRARLMVLDCQGSQITFPVHDVYGVHRYHEEELTPCPATVTRGNAGLSRSILSWNNQKVACLDEELLLAAIARSLS